MGLRLACLTDVHLDFVSAAGAEALAAEVREVRPDAVLVSGDIRQADHVRAYLVFLHERIGALHLQQIIDVA